MDISSCDGALPSEDCLFTLSAFALIMNGLSAYSRTLWSPHTTKHSRRGHWLKLGSVRPAPFVSGHYNLFTSHFPTHPVEPVGDAAHSIEGFIGVKGQNEQRGVRIRSS